jgi:hypothetical protein
MTREALILPVTVITPLKNERRGIELLWASIAGQTMQPAEWIVTDNGSTDGTYEWLRCRAQTSPFKVVVLSMPGFTIAKMMNHATEQATSSIIASCHGGTAIPSIWLQSITAPFYQEGVAAVFGTWRAFGTGRVDQRIAALTAPPLDQYDQRTYLAASRSLAFTKEVWREVGGFPEWLPKFGEDTLYAIRLRVSGRRIVVAPSAEVGWRPQSTWKKFVRQQYHYSEADGVMGLPARDRVRSGMRCIAILILTSFTVGVLGAPKGIGCLLLVLMADFLRANVRRARHGPFSYVLWFWVIPLAKICGFGRGRMLGWFGQVRVPAADQKAIHSYYHVRANRE